MKVNIGDKVVVVKNLWCKLNPYKHNQKKIIQTVTYADDQCFSFYNKCAPKSPSDMCCYYSQKNGQQYHSQTGYIACLVNSKETQAIAQKIYLGYKKKADKENKEQINKLLLSIENIKRLGYNGNFANLKKYSDYMEEIGVKIKQ